MDKATLERIIVHCGTPEKKFAAVILLNYLLCLIGSHISGSRIVHTPDGDGVIVSVAPFDILFDESDLSVISFCVDVFGTVDVRELFKVVEECMEMRS